MCNIFIFWVPIRCPCAGQDPVCNLCVKVYWLGIQGSACTPLNRSVDITLVFVLLGFWLRGNIWLWGLGHMIAAIPALFSRRRRHIWREYIRVYNAEHPEIIWYKFRGKRWSFQVEDWPSIRQVVDERAKDQGELAAHQLRTSRLSSWITKVLAGISSALRATRLWVTMLVLIIWALAIVNTEKTLALNMELSMDSWSYGQIFALVATVPSVYSLLQLVLRLGRTTEQPAHEDGLFDSSEAASLMMQNAASVGTGCRVQRWYLNGGHFERHSW